MGGTYCNFTKVENEMDSASTWNGRGFLQAKKVYGEYAVDSDADKLYIYIPSSTIEGIERLETMVDRSNISLAVQKYFEKEEEQWEIMYDTEHFSISGKYAREKVLQYNDFCFL